jgi:hypothetical protein
MIVLTAQKSDKVEPLQPGADGVRQTVRAMAELVRDNCASPELRRWVHEQLHAAGVAPHDHESEIEWAYWHAQNKIEFRRDPVGEEHLTNPLRILDQLRNPARYRGVPPAEDCDGKSVWFACLLGAMGHRARFVVTERGDGAFTHVYCEFFWPRTREWIPADPTPQFDGWKPAIGWEPPAARRHQFSIWSSPADGVGFDPTGAIGTGISIIGGLFGRKKQRQQAERLRDSVWQSSLDQIVAIRKAVEGRNTDPTAALLQGQQIYGQWRQTTDSLPDSVRKSAYTVGKKGEKSHLFWIDTALADLRREVEKAQAEQRQLTQAATGAAAAAPTPSNTEPGGGRAPLLPGSGPGGTNTGGVPVALIGVGAAVIVGFLLLRK